MKHFSLLLMTFAHLSAAQAQDVQRNIPYADPAHERQVLDVYSPRDAKNLPIVVWIHGGGWHSGDKSEVDEKPEAFVNKGFVCVSINYRLLPDGVTIKHMAEDVAHAIRWVYERAQHYGGDPNTIFVTGHSAGAQLAALVCTDEAYLAAEGLPLSVLKGCVPVDGDTYDVPLQIATVEQRRADIYTKKFGNADSQKDLSPVAHVARKKGIPPFLILHVADHPETRGQSERLANALQQAGVSATAYAAQAKTHTTINSELGLPDDKPTQALFEFLIPAAIYRKCDSQIPWITDGVDLVHGSSKTSQDTGVDRMELLEEAKQQAREQNRLILWYCMRVPGTHMTRAANLDDYMRVAPFTDPAFVELVRTKFVPVRMMSDEKLGEATGVRWPEFLEPGFIFLTPEGQVVHTIDRIRTFNADWFRAALIAVLRQHPEFNDPVGDSVEELLQGGDDDKALDKATPDQKAIILLRAGKYREVLTLPCEPVHQGIARLGLQDFDEARKILEKVDSAPALYHLAAAQWWAGENPEATWKKLVQRYPETPWAWRAASNLVLSPDGLPYGPMSHNLEDFFLHPPQKLPTSTCQPSEDFDLTTRRAVEFLLRAQRPSGSWNDSRYAYGWAQYMIKKRIEAGLLDPNYVVWPDVKLRPNVYTAVTALSALALWEWRDVAPTRIDAALNRAEKYLFGEASPLAPNECSECYGETFRLWYLAKKKDVVRMKPVVARVAELQDEDGFWGHEYPSAFATAVVIHTLVQAQQAGAQGLDPLLERAAKAMLKTRREGGRQDYRHEPGKGPSSEKDTAGRAAICELALFHCGQGSLENVSAGVEIFWKHRPKLEAVRQTDNHADGELAGFFYFYSVLYTLESARALPEPGREEHLRKFRDVILAVPEWDGSFLDSHNLGKSYGTAMALLTLKRTQ